MIDSVKGTAFIERVLSLEVMVSERWRGEPIRPLCVGCVQALWQPGTLVAVARQNLESVGEDDGWTQTTWTSQPSPDVAIGAIVSALNSGAVMVINHHRGAFVPVTTVDGMPLCVNHTAVWYERKTGQRKGSGEGYYPWPGVRG